jgi:hypothetical protein
VKISLCLWPKRWLLTDALQKTKVRLQISERLFSEKFSANRNQRKKNKRKDFERRTYIAKDFSAKYKMSETVNNGWGCRRGWGWRFAILQFAILSFAVMHFCWKNRSLICFSLNGHPIKTNTQNIILWRKVCSLVSYIWNKFYFYHRRFFEPWNPSKHYIQAFQKFAHSYTTVSPTKISNRKFGKWTKFWFYSKSLKLLVAFLIGREMKTNSASKVSIDPLEKENMYNSRFKESNRE